MTDDLIMEAITDYTGGENAAVLAVQAGNDMLVSSDFVTQYNAVLAAVQDGTLSADRIRESAVRVIRWKAGPRPDAGRALTARQRMRRIAKKNLP